MIAYWKKGCRCILDDVQYHNVEMNEIPAGYTSIPVLVNDNGAIHETRMVAGLLGMQVSSSGEMMDSSETHAGKKGKKRYVEVDGDWEMVEEEYVPSEPTEAPGLDSLVPLAGWIMYEVRDDVYTGDDYTLLKSRWAA